MKIYDSCRSKDCLAPPELGPARCFDGRPIEAPDGARTVTIDDLKVARIVVMKKEPSPFRNGFWDMELQYVFCYDLKFFGPEGRKLDEVGATSSFTRRVSLFGSVAREVSLFTDILGNHETLVGGGDPFLMVEAKAIPLTAEISRRGCGGGRDDDRDDDGRDGRDGRRRHRHVFVTLGLFSIVKLYRLVSLMVESRGFVIPPPCRNVMPPNPCDFFDELDFPMDSFAPPQRREFMEGKSINISAAMLECDESEDGN
jgi:hypothetical protein